MKTVIEILEIMNKPDVTELNLAVLNSNDEEVKHQYNQLKEYTYHLLSELESLHSSYIDLSEEHEELAYEKEYWHSMATIPEDEWER